MLNSLVFAFVVIGAVSFFISNLKKIAGFIRLGQKDDRFDNPAARIKKVLQIAFAQTKLLRQPVAGSIHLLIFWGFVLFSFTVIESFIQGFFPSFSFSFTGPFYLVITLVQDVLGLLVLGAIAAAFIRRFMIKIPRLQVSGHARFDAIFVLSMITIIVLSMYGQNVCHWLLASNADKVNEVRPVTAVLSILIQSVDTDSIRVMFHLFWWIHILGILTFLNYLPYSKHFHIISSIPNVYFSKTEQQRGSLKPLNLEDESAETFGADDIEKLSWKQLLDGYACTECGRCTAACPAATTGKQLSPRKIITDIRKRVQEAGPIRLSGKQQNEDTQNTLLHNFITDTELWQCTTCAACVQECPVMIEHIDTIVDLRRFLVLSESNFPPGLNNTFKNLETNGTPWAFSQSGRADWAEGLNISTMAQNPQVEYLYWVGCTGSYDARYKKVSRAFASLMQRAGVSFSILGTEEKCTGDSARRLGNEYLAQQLIMENVSTLNQYGVKKIVTACPHCLNSIRNDFSQFGGNYEVIHHSELIASLIQAGKLPVNNGVRKVTYHDSCYLGRYNNTYEAPREVIGSFNIPGVTEMQRNKSRGLCCGAGGGQMFLEETEGTRINLERTREAIATGAELIATACPFCMTMLTDGVKTLEKTDSVSVKDIAEEVFDNLKT
ncbi:MAG: (Fe-S)-binding protein [Ignavibacteria bacterium]|nr:(Fe-S)-binding protein [Ignavibacteria bacterium]